MKFKHWLFLIVGFVVLYYLFHEPDSWTKQFDEARKEVYNADESYLKMLKEFKCATDRQIVEMEHINRDLIKAFPFLKILDSIIDWTSGIKWTKVQDRRNNEIYEATKIPWENYRWRFRFKVNEEYWFSDDTPDERKSKLEYRKTDNKEYKWIKNIK